MNKSLAEAALIIALTVLLPSMAQPVNLNQPYCMEVAGPVPGYFHKAAIIDVLQDCAVCEKAIHQPNAGRVTLTKDGHKIAVRRPLHCELGSNKVEYDPVLR